MKPFEKASNIAQDFVPHSNIESRATYEEVREACMQMCEWTKEQMIDKACESFCENCRQDDCRLTACLHMYGFREKLIKNSCKDTGWADKHSNAVSINYLQSWYLDSIDETKEPIWTDKHIRELFNDFYLIPKQL